MEKQKKRKSDLHIPDSILSGVIVLYATYLIQNFSESKALLAVLFFMMAVENAIRLAEGKRTKTQRFCAMSMYIAGAVLILILDPFHASMLAAAAVEFLVILFNRAIAIIRKPKVRVILFNIVCILIVMAIAFIFFGSDMIINMAVDMESAEMQANPGYSQIAESIEAMEALDDAYAGSGTDMFFYLLLMILILLRLILHVVGISVSQMKLKILANIIRETYVAEILLGLLLMIIACSTIFSTLEESMADYGDALWYSFALVTTIGFGDITASTLIGRILSVFLGIYGIVVVAIITSVIVNFYGEMRRINEVKTDGETESDLPERDESPDSEE